MTKGEGQNERNNEGEEEEEGEDDEGNEGRTTKGMTTEREGELYSYQKYPIIGWDQTTRQQYYDTW